jgi:hypothetical protein
MPVARPVAFRVPRVVNDRLSKTEFRLFDDEDEARRAACDIGADYDGLFLVADRRAAFFAQPRPSTEPQTAPSDIERAFRDACDEAGCAYDNEALLEAIQALKERCQAEIVPVPKAALDWLFGEGVGARWKLVLRRSGYRAAHAAQILPRLLVALEIPQHDPGTHAPCVHMRRRSRSARRAT